MEYLILISSIVLGAITVFALKLNDTRHVKVVNAFTGAFLLTIVVLHLLPEIYLSGSSEEIKPLYIGGFILLGFFLQIAMDSISMGIEHGHTHRIRGRMAVGILAGLCIHAFVEAMALGHNCGGGHHDHDHSAHKFLLLSIVIHNYPITIALLVMLLQSGMKRRSALGCLALFAAMAPLGMWFSNAAGLAEYSRYLMAMVIGIFMHISTMILFESEDHHRISPTKLMAVLLGLLLGVGSVMFGHG